MWIYNDIELLEAPEGAVGFIYRIDINNGFYYGKKEFYNTRKKKFGKKKLAELTDKRLKTYEMVRKESNWKLYCSSSDTIENLVKSGHIPRRTILRICYSLKELSFHENKLIYATIQDTNNLNENCSGTYYKEEIMKWL